MLTFYGTRLSSFIRIYVASFFHDYTLLVFAIEIVFNSNFKLNSTNWLSTLYLDNLLDCSIRVFDCFIRVCHN